MVGVVIVAGAVAHALPPAGASVPYVAMAGTDGREHRLPDARVAVLVIYEDQNAGKQNLRAKDVVGAFNRRAENRAHFEVWPVADLEKWNWWPAKKYVFERIHEISKQENTRIFCDWTGAVRAAWGLTKGKSAYVLVAADGHVLFAGEGPLAEPQVQELAARLRALGAVSD